MKIKPIFLVIILLAAALAWEKLQQKNQTLEALAHHYPNRQVQTNANMPGVFTLESDTQPPLTAYTAQATGWGGPMTLMAVVDPAGDIQEFFIPQHRETPAFFEYVQSTGLVDKLARQSLTAHPKPLDLDGVTGATLTSRALVSGMESCLALAAKDRFNTPMAPPEPQWQVGKWETAVALLLTIAGLSAFFKIRKARVPVAAAAFLLMGLTLKRPVSVSNLGALFLGHLPELHTHLLWWLLVPGSLALVLLLGKNIYCTWLCPFGTLQEWLSRISGIAIKVPRSAQRLLKTVTQVITLAALTLALATGNTAPIAMEPFSTLFGLRGTSLQWYLVSVVLMAALVIPRFWCRFFCPAGVCFNQAARLKNQILKSPPKPKRQPLTFTKTTLAVLAVALFIWGVMLATLAGYPGP